MSGVFSMDFKETLKVVKNSSCFLSYSFQITQEDLANESSKVLDSSKSVSLTAVSDLIDEFCETQDKANIAVNVLLQNGMVEITEEY